MDTWPDTSCIKINLTPETDMDQEPVFYAPVSVHLSRVLDEIGLNTLTVQRRRQAYLHMETLCTTCCRLLGQDMTDYHFGSQIEGTTTIGLYSDLDKLTCLHDFNVIQDWSEWQQGKINLLMFQEENTAPGYCRLQLLRSDMPLPREDLPNEHCVLDRCNRVLVKNTVLHVLQLERNGPAQSRVGGSGFTDKDYVIAFKCTTWPKQTESWIRRRRRGHWPTQDIIRYAVEKGVFLVPVGHRTSQTESLEWRISPSLAERRCMFSMNITQIKCYVALKMVMKTCIIPKVGKSISSFHCKTTMFYCMENEDPEIWREENLLSCINKCLVLLRTWLINGHCPQFIIPEEDLFAGKMSMQTMTRVAHILQDLIQSDGRFLLHVSIDGLGERLHGKLSAVPVHVPVLDSRQSIEIVGMLEFDMFKALSYVCNEILIKNTSPNTQTVIKTVHQMINNLPLYTDRSNMIQRAVYQRLMAFLSTWLGSLIASYSLSQIRDIPQQALHCFRIGTKSDISSKLKLASVFFCNADLAKAELLLRDVEERNHRNNLQPVCNCYNNTFQSTQEFDLKVFTKVRGIKCDKLIAHCVRFTPHEVYCTPPALRHEMFRSFGEDVLYRGEDDDWMDLAVVDSLPYMYYLQFMTYKQLGNQELKERSLLNLTQCITEDQNLAHSETALNLLGQCMELEQRPEDAMNCYKISLRIRPRNNAAKWHVQNLCYMQITNGMF